MDEARLGMNQFCGPAALSILTGNDSDQCANVISQVNGKYKVKGVTLPDLIRAGNRMGLTFAKQDLMIGRSLYFTASLLSQLEGMYLVCIPKHFIILEVASGVINLCDNHTKQPINLHSSARLSQKVEDIYKVEKLPAVVPPKMLKYEYNTERVGSRIMISKIHSFDDGTVKIYPQGSFECPLEVKDLQDIAFAIMKIADSSEHDKEPA